MDAISYYLQQKYPAVAYRVPNQYIAAVTTNELKVHNKLYQTQPKGYFELNFVSSTKDFSFQTKIEISEKFFVSFTK